MSYVKLDLLGCFCMAKWQVAVFKMSLISHRLLFSINSCYKMYTALVLLLLHKVQQDVFYKGML